MWVISPLLYTVQCVVLWIMFFWHVEFRKVEEVSDQSELFVLHNFFCKLRLFHFQGSDCNLHKLNSSIHCNFIQLLFLSVWIQKSNLAKKAARLIQHHFQAFASTEQLENKDYFLPKEEVQHHLLVIHPVFHLDSIFMSLIGIRAKRKIQE